MGVSKTINTYPDGVSVNGKRERSISGDNDTVEYGLRTLSYIMDSMFSISPEEGFPSY